MAPCPPAGQGSHLRLVWMPLSLTTPYPIHQQAQLILPKFYPKGLMPLPFQPDHLVQAPLQATITTPPWITAVPS